MNRTTHCFVATVLAISVVSLSVALAASETPTTSSTQSHAAWLGNVLTKITAIKHGTLRRDFEKTFEMDGGLQGISPQRYCYRDAPCIKVNATFATPAASTQPFSDPEVTLLDMSKPYLESPYAD
jgi:hypothetical protein